MSAAGRVCRPWRDTTAGPGPGRLELLGGHNYCRNPAGEAAMEEPWCFTDNNVKQVRGIPNILDD